MKAKIAESQSTTEARLLKMEAEMMKSDKHLESKIDELRSEMKEIKDGQQKIEAMIASLAGLQVAAAAPSHGLTPAAPLQS